MQWGMLPPRLQPLADYYHTSSLASATGLGRHPALPGHGLWVTTLWPLPYGHTAVFAIGPHSELSPVLFSRTSGDTCTAS